MSKGKMSRDKGNRGQLQVAKLFANWWGTKFASTPLSGGFATPKFRQDWNAAGDIVTPDAAFPFCVEVKYQESWDLDQILTSDACTVWKWWDQCIRETPAGKTPLLVFRKNRKKWMCMISTIHLPKGGLGFRHLNVTTPSVSIFMLSSLLGTDKSDW